MMRLRWILTLSVLGLASAATLAGSLIAQDAARAERAVPSRSFRVRLSWGHRSLESAPWFVRLVPAASGMLIQDAAGWNLEGSDGLADGVVRSTAGAGDVDGVECTLEYQEPAESKRRTEHSIWNDLLTHSDVGAVNRLRSDPAFQVDARLLTVQLNEEGTRGFSVSVEQLLRERALWCPDLDVFLTAGDELTTFEQHQAAIEPYAGQRILDQLQREPEATYEQYSARWEDMGSPAYRNPHSVSPGHIVGVTWDSAIPKFGIDRWAGVASDYGNPDKLKFQLDLQGWEWKGQRLTDGLPVLTTTFERSAVRLEVEQFAYPLLGPPPQRRGDIAMVLLQKVRATALDGTARTLRLNLRHERSLPDAVEVSHLGSTAIVEETSSHRVLFSVQGVDTISDVTGANKSVTAALVLNLPPTGAKEIVLKLPLPLVEPDARATLAGLDYAAARAATLRFWEDYLARGAQFRVPEQVVNDLFRANLWHALRLPRRHGGNEPGVRMDLPYSNFAYDQRGTPWPVNQAIYVDYMLYDLRGYHAVSAEELAAIYRNNQEANGRVGGFANWGVYTPSMLYAVAQHGLLSADRTSIDALLPATLKAGDWCLAEIARAQQADGPTRGLIRAPLNDLSHDPQAWAFNQAYFYAGCERLARLLRRLQHPRAAEFQQAADQMRQAVERGFGQAAMRAPLVPLRDRTWIPYVPADAATPRRLLEVWYPTDVDTGSLHLSRLAALAPRGPLTTYLLHDHEDNLFLNGWGMANEPVYNQHATAYLRRDDVKPAIRAFYSMLACAFSHSALEPVEHRWGWGQYFGPPSTDGAWFDLYRHILIQEQEDETLFLLPATPRKWLEDGEQIEIRRAPTYFGPLNMTVESRAASGTIRVSIEMPQRSRPGELIVRLRHPAGNRMTAAKVNGADWPHFEPDREWVRITDPDQPHYEIVASYR
ncbi:MAG: hypothetical protein KJ000_25935 [Pirellulaceae bacterium]|nr:hypothetical protein [Pirellulaceae bacterium]